MLILSENELNPQIIYANYYIGMTRPNHTSLDARIVYDYELELITEVEDGYMLENGQSITIKKGDLIFRRPHTFTQGHNRYNSYILCFEATQTNRILKEAYLLDTIKNFQVLVDHILLNQLPSKFNTNYFQRYLTAFKEIFTDYAAPHLGSTLHIRSLLTNMLYQMNKEYHALIDFNHPKAYIIHNVIEYIETNLQADLSLRILAEQYEYSPIYFHQLFKTITGENLSHFVIEKRMEKAIELLIHTNSSIKSICYDVGYKNPSYFTSAFYKYTDFTPKVYRDTYQIKYN